MKKLKGKRMSFHVKTLIPALCIALACHSFSRKMCSFPHRKLKIPRANSSLYLFCKDMTTCQYLLKYITQRRQRKDRMRPAKEQKENCRNYLKKKVKTLCKTIRQDRREMQLQVGFFSPNSKKRQENSSEIPLCN